MLIRRTRYDVGRIIRSPEQLAGGWHRLDRVDVGPAAPGTKIVPEIRRSGGGTTARPTSRCYPEPTTSHRPGTEST
jgi:hypothetical protein